MIGASSLYRMGIASGNIWFLSPEWWRELTALMSPWRSALAIEHWRMMIRMHQSMPLPMRMLMRLNSSFMNSSIGEDILSITGYQLFSFLSLTSLFNSSEFSALRDSFVGLRDLPSEFT